MGYIRGFVHGAIVGSVVGICVAPQAGDRTRQQLSAFAEAARNGAQMAERTVRRVAPLAGFAASMARHQVEKVRTDREESDASGVRIHNETNGRR